MTGLLTQLVVRLNAAADAVGRWLFAPIAWLPGWLSVTVVAAASGVLLLAVFKYTSNQRAIKRVRDDIKAHLLALKLFKESTPVALRAQGRILRGAGLLAALAVVPVLVMALPVSLLLAQLALWYEARPLHVGEDAVVTLKLNGGPGSTWPAVRLEPTDGVHVTLGPVRVQSEREVCWNIRADADGYHLLHFHVGDSTADKAVAVGDGFMRVSSRRPAWDWYDALWHPGEAPFRADSPVQTIEVRYDAERPSWTSGTGYWVVYWFAVSMVSAFCFRRVLNVNL